MLASKPISRAVPALVALCLGTQAALAAPAEPPRQTQGIAPALPATAAPQSSLVLEAGAGRVLQAGRAIANLFAADPKVAEVRPASPTSLFVFGIAPGRTTIAALDESGGVVAQYDVLVRPSRFAAAEAQGAIARALPGTGVSVDTTPNGLTLRGTVATPAEAEQAMAVARGYATEKQTVDNRLSVQSATQVNLRVRIAEVARNVTRQFGINWAALGTIGKFTIAGATLDTLTDPTNPPNRILASYVNKGADANALLDLLAQDNLATILAEPNLTAMSGETASFLAGGEYPIPVAQQNQTITIDFKQYGVSLAFVPTVISPSRISLHVRPEVSQLTTQGAVQIQAGNSTLQIPALTVRRADTTVELGSGQSFAIAGLLQAQSTHGATGLPYLGELPVIGALFRSDKFQRQETELVILITPYIVRPVSDPRRLAAPTDDYVPPNDADRVLYNRQRAAAAGLPRPMIGDAGFMMH